jgi:hypothetical protein
MGGLIISSFKHISERQSLVVSVCDEPSGYQKSREFLDEALKNSLCCYFVRVRIDIGGHSLLPWCTEGLVSLPLGMWLFGDAAADYGSDNKSKKLTPILSTHTFQMRALQFCFPHWPRCSFISLQICCGKPVHITLLTYLLTSPLRSHWNIRPQQLYNCWGFYSS